MAKLTGSGPHGRLMDAWFGNSVAISGDYAVVGVPGDTFNGAGTDSVRGSGSAYIFHRVNGVWTFQQKLVADSANRTGFDAFGYSVAISGDYVIIGAHSQTFYISSNFGDWIRSAGAAYVFKRTGTTWSQQQKLVVADPHEAAYFGYSVAISGDYALVGAPQQPFNAAGADSLWWAGAAYIFNRSGATWSQQQKLVGTGANGRKAYDLFGYSVALSGDDAVVGAYGQDYNAAGIDSQQAAGAAYIFNRSSTTWGLHQKLVGTGTNGRIRGDNFGVSVGISGNTLIVGAPGQDYNANGVITGISAGAAYIFTRTGTGWNPQQKLVVSSSIGGNNGQANQFGYSVSVSGDSVLVGSPYQSFVGSPGGGQWYQETYAGAAYLFGRSSGTWTQLQPNIVPHYRYTNERFGNAVAISGGTAFIGCNYHSYDTAGHNRIDRAGAAYIFEASASQGVSAPAAASGSGIFVAPQPVRERFTLTGSNASLEGTEAVVLDVQGREVLRFKVQNGRSIDAGNWPAGLYLLRLANGSVLRLIKE